GHKHVGHCKGIESFRGVYERDGEVCHQLKVDTEMDADAKDVWVSLDNTLVAIGPRVGQRDEKGGEKNKFERNTELIRLADKERLILYLRRGHSCLIPAAMRE